MRGQGVGWQPVVLGHGGEGEPGRGHELAGSFCCSNLSFHSSSWLLSLAISPPLCSWGWGEGQPGYLSPSIPTLQEHQLPEGGSCVHIKPGGWDQERFSSSSVCQDNTWGHLSSPSLVMASRALPRPIGHPWGLGEGSHPCHYQGAGWGKRRQKSVSGQRQTVQSLRSFLSHSLGISCLKGPRTKAGDPSALTGCRGHSSMVSTPCSPRAFSLL